MYKQPKAEGHLSMTQRGKRVPVPRDPSSSGQEPRPSLSETHTCVRTHASPAEDGQQTPKQVLTLGRPLTHVSALETKAAWRRYYLESKAGAPSAPSHGLLLPKDCPLCRDLFWPAEGHLAAFPRGPNSRLYSLAGSAAGAVLGAGATLGEADVKEPTATGC